MTPKEVQASMAPFNEAFTALRQGRADFDHWGFIQGAHEIATAVEQQGVVRGLKEHLASIGESVKAIEARALASGQWKAPTLYSQEIEAVQLLMELLQFQKENLSYGEFTNALRKAIARAQTQAKGHVAR